MKIHTRPWSLTMASWSCDFPPLCATKKIKCGCSWNYFWFPPFSQAIRWILLLCPLTYSLLASSIFEDSSTWCTWSLKLVPTASFLWSTTAGNRAVELPAKKIVDSVSWGNESNQRGFPMRGSPKSSCLKNEKGFFLAGSGCRGNRLSTPSSRVLGPLQWLVPYQWAPGIRPPFGMPYMFHRWLLSGCYLLAYLRSSIDQSIYIINTSIHIVLSASSCLIFS